jgi:hypothetical protein
MHPRSIAAVILALAASAAAQQQAPRTPRVGYVYPAGGKQGTTFQVTVGGQYLDGVDAVRISGTGVRASVVQITKPLTPAQATQLREKLQELMTKRAAAMAPRLLRPASRPASRPVWTAEDEKQLAEIREKLATFVRRPSSPAIAETALVQVTIAPDAQAGVRELRLGAPVALTNPLVFCVGQLPEVRETEPPGSALMAAMDITLPSVVNGQIMPGDIDRYRFKAKKGQKIVAAVSARELIPYIADAVPGWFQATLSIRDAKGNEVAYTDDFRFKPDPVVYYEIPADGEYVAQITDSIYRGREDFVYRLSIGELPFITSVFPLGMKAGASATVELRGWNLPLANLTPTAKLPGIQFLSVQGAGTTSNRVPFAADTLSEVAEQEPNNLPGTARLVSPPVIINGRIDQSGDVDVFRFEGRAGDAFVAEVIARRLDSPLDSILRLTDSAGNQLAINDDREDKAAGLETHHADSWLSTPLPATGVYYVYLRDAQNKGGPEYAYRLRLSGPRPDFELRVAPSSLSVRGGATLPITVYALRRDGFSGDIALGLNGSPPGFELGGARVPSGQDQVRITLTAPPVPTKEPLALRLEGRATIHGRDVVRPVVPAEDMMQAFAYRHLVPAQELTVVVSGRFMARNPARITSPLPLRIPLGGTAPLQIGMPANTLLGPLQLELSEPPEGITIRGATAAGFRTDVVVACDGAKVKVGLKGNLIVNAFAQRNPTTAEAKAAPGPRRVPLGTLPAVPFEIVAR